MASGLYSHPGILLEDHSNSVLFLVRDSIKELTSSFWRENKNRQLLEMAAALHDFGKATEYFQAVLQGQRNRDEYSRHARLSAFFFLYQATKWLGEEWRSCWLSLLFSFLYVLRHHTNLHSVSEDLRQNNVARSNPRALEVMEDQVLSISPGKVNVYLSSLNLSGGIKVFFSPEEFLAWIKEKSSGVISELSRCWRKRWRKRESSAEDYVNFLLGLSVFLDADKIEAGVKALMPQRVGIDSSIVDDYEKKAFRSSRKGIDELRKRAYREVSSSELLSPDNHVYTITLPTGLGKTLTGLSAALKLREMVYRKTGKMPRIIYALPFLSIIEQNASVIENAFREVYGKVDSQVVVKHHHLAEMRYLKRNGKGVGEELQEYDYAASKLLIEGWHSEIVVTTFVQLFNTLIAWQNAHARRFSRLCSAIVLIDEVQALPAEYWPLMRKLFKEVARCMDAYVILMTATQPYLVENAVELVSDPERYFNALNRFDVEVDLKPQTIEKFVGDFVPESGKSYLFIANTIGSAQEIYRFLSEKVSEDVVFLSTGVIPRERRARIEMMRSKKCRFAVTTQLVEAGVDVDFDVVYRDVAPLDSLVQSAGRCNRHFDKEKRGKMVVVKLVNDEGKPYASYVYDLVLLDRTVKRLSERVFFQEPVFLSLLKDYFQDVWKSGVPYHVSDVLWDAVCKLRFDGEKDKPCVTKNWNASGAYLSQFCLIKDQPYKHDVFVQVDEDAVRVWNEAKNLVRSLKEVKQNADRWKIIERINRIKPQFYQYVISVGFKKEDVWFEYDEDLHVYVISSESVEDFYDERVGFKKEHVAII